MFWKNQQYSRPEVPKPLSSKNKAKFRPQQKNLGLFIALVFCFFTTPFVQAQNKVNITTTNPSEIHLCAEGAWLEIDVRNITTSTLSGLTAEISLPSGMQYISGTITGTNVSENNISNLQKPVFDLPNLGLAKSSTFRIQIFASCNMISFISGGGLVQAKTKINYPGGSTAATASPMTVLQPSVRITNITNQFATIDKGKNTIRHITITNGGKGKIANFLFRQVNQSGLKPLGHSGGKTNQNGDTMWSEFTKQHFTTVGNKDSFLSQGESVTIIDTIKAIDCSNLKSFYNLVWGCNGSNCAADNASANISITNKSAKLQYLAKSSTTVCQSNSNKHLQELRIVNNGNDTARDLVVEIFQSYNGGFYQYQMSQIDVASLEYSLNSASFKQITPSSTRGTYTSGAYACLGNGAIGGVELAMNDLLPRDTLYFRWYSVGCCSDVCGQNFYAHRWRYDATYTDQCNTAVDEVEGWGSVGIYQGFGASSYTPSDIIANQTVELNFPISAANLLAPTSSAEMIIQLVLPDGLKHSVNANDLLFENHNNQSWKPNSIYQSNDTVFAVFKGSPKLTLVRAELRIQVTGDCSNFSSNKDQDYSVNILYNPDPSCNSSCFYPLFCFNSSIRVHCDKSCKTGFRFSEFEANRVTYGEPDNNNDGEPDTSGSLDLSRIKRERVMVGDTLRSTFRGSINRVGSTTSWRYLKASTVMEYGYYMKVADVRLKIYRSGNLLYNCNGIASSYSTSGYTRTFTFDVGVSALISAKCPLYSGFTFGIKDSVELEVSYVYDINPGGVIREVSLTNEMYLSTVSNPNSSQRYQCDTFGGKFVQIGYYFTNYGRGVYSSNSCSEFVVSQNYYLSVGACCSNYAGNNIFPYEYRNWAIAKEAMVILPKGFDLVYTRFYQYRTAGTGVAKWQYTDSLQPTYYSQDTVVFDFEQYHTSKGGNLIESDDGFHGVVYYKLRANCNARQGTSTIEYNYIMDGKNYLDDVLDTVKSGSNSDQIQYEKPIVTLTAAQNDIKATSDTAEWYVRLSNSSSTSNASNLFLSYFYNGNAKIVDVKYYNSTSTIKPVADIYQLGNLNSGQSLDLVVRAVFKDCDRDSFPLYVGFNCVGYPDSFAAFPCAPVVELLKYTPVNTRLSASLDDNLAPVDLCASVPYEVTITNEGEARAYNIYLDLVLREGMILNDSAWGFEPGTSDSFLVTSPQPIGNNTYRYYISSASTNLKNDGLPGFTSKLSNELTFKFYLNTNCNFVSSSYFLLRPGGNLNCGMPVISGYGIGKPINIKEVEKPYFSSLTFNLDPLDVCNYNGKMQFKFINLGPDTTGTKDKIQLLLPDGIYVDTTYLKSFYNAPKSTPVITNNGQYKAEWNIPQNMVPGDSTYFEINTFVVPSELPCGYAQIVGQAVVKQPALCVKDSSICNIDVATSSQLVLDSIQKSIYSIQYISAISKPSGNNEEATLTYRISNSGAIKIPGNPLVVKFLDDVNGNQRQDVGESIIYTDTIWGEISDTVSVTLKSTFGLSSPQSCRLVLIIDSTNCVCDDAFVKIPPIRIINAGRDTSACSYSNISIGSPSLPGAKYLWSPGNGIKDTDSSETIFSTTNLTSKDSTFQLVLTTQKGSCSTKDTAHITLYPAMQMKLETMYQLCRGDSVIIGDLVKGGKGFKSYQWTPDYAINNANSVKVWAKPDTSTQYSIFVKDGQGCTMADTTFIEVIDKPIANFSFSDTCVGALFQFQNNSSSKSSTIDSVHWTFQELDESINFSPAIFIDSSRTMDVTLHVVDAIGCTDDTTQTVTAFPLPVSNFVAHDDCQFDSSLYRNLSSIEYGSFSSTWEADGKSINSTDFDYTYQTSGIKIVSLTNVSDRGCSSSISDTLEIHVKPVIDLKTTNVCLGDSSQVSISNSASSDTLQNIFWKLSDGNITNGPASLKHQYQDTGSHSLEVIASTQWGCSDTANGSQFIYALPNASLQATDVCLGLDNIVKSTSNVTHGVLNKYSWDIGVGYNSGADSVRVSFPTAGKHPISLVVESSFGCFDTAQGTAIVHYEEVPNVSFSGVCQFDSFLFNTSPLHEDSLNQLSFSFGSDTIHGSAVKYAFSNSGNQNVSLLLTTNQGCSTDTTFTVFVAPKPIAQFSINYPCEDNIVDFVDQSISSTGTIDVWNYDLGDGSTRSIGSFQYMYSTAGVYSSVLEVTNNYGCKDTVNNDVTIKTVVNPSLKIQDQCVWDSTLVVNTSNGLLSKTGVDFDMGNGDIISDRDSFYYTYTLPGSYNVTMTLKGPSNCTYEAKGDVEIHQLPTPGFDLDPPTADVLNSDISIIDRSIGAQDYLYELTDGNTYITPNFTHHFEDSGSYRISQILTSQFGCVDSTFKELHINYLVNILIPDAFSPNGDGLNEVFQPGGLGLIHYDLSIFNRWGERIFFSDSGEPWTGENAIPGLYFYALKMIDYNNKIYYSYGQVMLLR